MIPTESRSARHELAALMRRFYTGRITNWQFEDAAEELSNDEITREVFHWGPFGSYSDVPEYRLADRTALTAESRRIAARWILFLQSDQPYRWPIAARFPSRIAWLTLPLLLSSVPLAVWLHRWELTPSGFLLLILFGHIHERITRKRIISAHKEILWPFASTVDYETALRNPPFLTGNAR